MSKTRKFRKHYKKQKKQKKKSKTLHRKKKYIGGFGEGVGFPTCTNVTKFKITNTQIAKFKRDLNMGMDCFINALQIFGLLSSKCANILRLSSAARTGFTTEEMESIFIYLNNRNFCFKPYDSFTGFRDIIQRNLNPGEALFVGFYTIGPDSRSFFHVFIIARSTDGVAVIIDPQQIPEKVALLNDEGISKYLLFPRNRTLYYILHSSSEELNINQLEYVKDIRSGIDPQAAGFKYFSTLSPAQRAQVQMPLAQMPLAQMPLAQMPPGLMAPAQMPPRLGVGLPGGPPAPTAPAPTAPAPTAPAPTASAPTAPVPMDLK